MTKQNISINGIPAVIWGDPSDKLYIAVHGDMSNKEDTVIELLADAAAKKGYQVLSFDLPEHGERKQEATLCKVEPCVADLAQVMAYAKASWSELSVFACSIGAYFSLVAYAGEPLRNALFLSPVVDMQRLIENMMMWFQVTPEMLQEKGAVATPMGKILYWDYYTWVKAHPVQGWSPATRILYGGKDNLCEREVVQGFADAYHCELEIVADGEHFFHTEDQLAQYKAWLESQISY